MHTLYKALVLLVALLALENKLNYYYYYHSMQRLKESAVPSLFLGNRPDIATNVQENSSTNIYEFNEVDESVENMYNAGFPMVLHELQDHNEPMKSIEEKAEFILVAEHTTPHYIMSDYENNNRVESCDDCEERLRTLEKYRILLSDQKKN